MAKPRIFVSSTYYDLKHIRTSLESFIHSFGYEPVLFESGDIYFSPDKPLDESCFAELNACHMQVLIIGGSYGSPESGTKLTEEEALDPYKIYNSVTRKEFQVALKRQIPIYFFVENSVLAEYTTYKKNAENHLVKYAHVSNVGIFHLLDEIYALKNGNFTHGFSKFEDIASWLRMQWAHLMTEFITNRTKQLELKTLSNSLESLSTITNSLEEYTKAILESVVPGKAQEIDQNLEKKRLAVINDHHLDVFIKSPIGQLLSSVSPDLDPKRAYLLFEASKTPEEFLSEAGLTEEEVNEYFLSRAIYRREFESLKIYISL